LSRRLRELGLEGLSEYRVYLEAHPGEWDTLDSLLRITISRFYRDRAVFDALRDPLLPALGRVVLGRGDPAVRSWCAGCASGEEPYSLSLAWDLDASQHMPGVELEIVATDVDSRLLERARTACYPPGALKELPSEWMAAAFDPAGETLCLRPMFRARVRLLRQDIRDEMPPGPFDLVLCRNLVFTYFERSLQALLLERILQRLAPRGLLVLGGHETLPPGDWPLDRPSTALPIHRLTEPLSPR
jgi:chemotaxis protein methyltransferase CheR